MITDEKRQWNDDTIGRVFGIIDETLYSIALYRLINPEKRETRIYDLSRKKHGTPYKTLSPAISPSETSFFRKTSKSER